MIELSVILPVFNGEQHLQKAIDSILNQTFSDFELIIINDGSSDRSLDIIKSYNDKRIVLIDQENKGLAKTLNVGLNIAKGTYIARMDADDIAYPDRFKKQMLYLKQHPEIKLLGGGIEFIDDADNSIGIEPAYIGSDFLHKFLFKIGNPFKHPTVIFDKEIAVELGGFNETIEKYMEDYFLWSQIARNYKTDNVRDILLKYRITPGSIMSSIKSDEFSSFILRVVNKGDFTEEDKREMAQIKLLDNERLSKMNKKGVYDKRVENAKRNKMNKLFHILKKIVGEKYALNFIIALKKKRVQNQLNND